MKSTLKTVLVCLIILSYSAYFISHLYFLPTLDLGSSLLLFIIDGICILVCFTSLCIYCFKQDNNSKIYKFISINVVVVVIFGCLFFTGSQKYIADYMFFKLREDQLNEIVEKVRSSDKINSIETRLGRYYDETSNLNESEIKKYNEILNKLNELNIIRLTKENGKLYFLTGGFLSGIGFVFSEHDNEPNCKRTDRTREEWQNLEGNWYSFASD